MTSSQPTLQQVIAWAKEAGKIALDGFHTEHAIQMKGKLDLATEIDHACEKVLMDHIKQDFPTHAIVTEETGVIEGDANNCWYIDPLDGTINYSHHLPVYAVSIAYAHNGVLSLGVVYDPSRDECFTAERGKGACLNGEPIHVSGCNSLQKALLTTGLPSWNEELLDRNLAPGALLNAEFTGSAPAGVDCHRHVLHRLRPYRRSLGPGLNTMGYRSQRIDH